MNGYSAKTEYFIFNNQPKLIQTKVGTALKKTQNCPCCTGLWALATEEALGVPVTPLGRMVGAAG